MKNEVFMKILEMYCKTHIKLNFLSPGPKLDIRHSFKTQWSVFPEVPPRAFFEEKLPTRGPSENVRIFCKNQKWSRIAPYATI